MKLIKGFTAIEFIIVVALIAIVISLAVGSGMVGPKYKCIDGILYIDKGNFSFQTVRDTKNKPKVCLK